MKKILLVGVVSSIFSASVFAAACTGTGGAQTVAAPTSTTGPTGELCVCNGGTAIKSTVNGGSGTPVATPVFIKTGFDVQCSNNTFVSYNEVSNTAFAVGSGSIKGNQSFAGNSNGGAVGVNAKCTGTNDACTAANVTSATAAAAAAAAGS
ncbi:MAG: hypothetical protein FIA96_13425 [Betaproteobacteria bacterium]|nr:hypothetical protein [Betaproteobacteria bacterium]